MLRYDKKRKEGLPFVKDSNVTRLSSSAVSNKYSLMFSNSSPVNPSSLEVFSNSSFIFFARPLFVLHTIATAISLSFFLVLKARRCPREFNSCAVFAFFVNHGCFNTWAAVYLISELTVSIFDIKSFASPLMWHP